MTIKCNFNGAIICSIVFIGGVAALFKVGIVDGTFNNVPFRRSRNRGFKLYLRKS